MGKKDFMAVPKMVVLQPAVINVSNPPDDKTCPDLDCGVYDELSALVSGEDAQNAIVSDSVLKRGILRSKLEGIEKERMDDDILLPDIDLDYSREDGK